MHELALKLQENPTMLLVATIVCALIPICAAVYFVMSDGAITVLTVIFAVLAIVIIVFGVRAYLASR